MRSGAQDDDTSQFWSLMRRIERLEQISSSEPEILVSSFSNGWGNFDATNRPARFYRHGGRVYLAGIISSGTIGLAAFTLPGDCLPTVTGGLDASWAVETNGGVAGFIRVNSSGVVTPNTGSNVFMFLDGIDFRHL
jgi:hypothetical protein